MFIKLLWFKKIQMFTNAQMTANGQMSGIRLRLKETNIYHKFWIGVIGTTCGFSSSFYFGDLKIRLGYCNKNKIK